MRIRILFLAAALALAGGGCEDEAARHMAIEQRLEEKVATWPEKNPVTPLTMGHRELLRIEAVQEVDKAIAEQRKLQREAAKDKAIEAAGHAATGNWGMFAWTGLSAVLLFFGLKNHAPKEGGTA
jgi:hypothetical protein